MRSFGGLLAAPALLLTLGLSLHGTSAAAAVPKLSGTYNVSTTTICQAAVPIAQTVVDVPPFTTVPTTTTVLTIDPNQTTYTGEVKQLLATVTFTPSKTAGAGTIVANGTQWGGDLVYTGTEQLTSPGLTQQPLSGASGTYTDSATQLVLIVGNTNTYQALYSGVVSGITQRIDLVSVYAVPNSGGAECIERGTAVHQ